MEVDDLTGRLITDENRTLMMNLATHHMLQHKLRLLQAPRRCPIAKEVVSLATTGYSLLPTATQEY
jgi:hypothetical protein